MKTAIVLIIFNRPSLTQKVFDEIKKAKPSQLFVISDGPRNENERTLVEGVRKIIKQVDWECNVYKKYSEVNLGCKISVSSGLDFVFSKVDRAIILEDDCVPDQSFFPYCEELLEKYQDKKEVVHITGTNLLINKKVSEHSYFFTKHVSVWGWATWKRAWKQYDVTMKDFSKNNGKILSTVFSNKRAQNTMQKQMFAVYENKIDTWDYQWAWAVWKNDALAIMPQSNLISNIGFGKSATHTKFSGKYDSMRRSSVDFPLSHPKSVQTNEDADQLLEQNLLLERILFDAGLQKIRSIARSISAFGKKP